MTRTKLLLCAICLVISACGDSQRSAEFILSGVERPTQNCKVPASQFTKAVAIPDFREANGCGISQGYRVFAIDDVIFTSPATVTCDVAAALKTWTDEVVQPAALASFNQRVVKYHIAASYACRGRNNVRGAKLSEHGLGNAIDISAFTFADGRTLSVKSDFYKNAKFFEKIHKSGCTYFSTTLGPGSDGYHEDHLHYDLQKRKSGRGKYCH